MQSWASDNNKNVNDSEKPPITIFTEIRKYNKAVIDAEVTALIHQASYNTKSSLELKDDGTGDPDITKNDGIYSRYLTDIPEPGYYSITVVAEKKVLKYYKPLTGKTKEDRCCGSFIPDYLSYESGSFRRVSTYQSFFVGKDKAGLTYSPRRIMDLRIDRIEVLSNKVKCYILKWTAPGENYDKGKALSYDIKVFKTREDALNKFHNSDVLTIKMLNIQGPLLVPLEAGTPQTAYVELTNLTSGTYYMALKTTGHSAKTSDVSNVVELTYDEQNPFITNTGDGYHTIPISGTTEITTGVGSNGSSNFGLAIGLTCGILFLLLIIGVFLLVYFSRNKKSEKKQNAAIICQNTKKTESSDALCHSNGGESISIISPVTSWDANSLVSRYETLQQHKSTNTNGVLTEPENRETDNISLPSSKYSYDTKIEQNSSIYDPIYYHQVRSQDEMNYPFNPTYTPFHPMYASSMRRLDDNQAINNNPYCSDNASFCSYSLPRNQSSRLKTDV